MKLFKLVQHHVQIGEPLPWNVRGSGGQLLLTKGHVIAGETQLEALLDRGAFVDWVEYEAIAAARAAASAVARPATLFDQWDETLVQLDKLLTSASEPGFAGRAAEIARRIGTLVERDTDIAIYLAVRQDARPLEAYGTTHGLFSAALCHLLSRRLGWSVDRCEVLTKAALTMNLSVLALQGRLAANDAPPTESQRAVLRLHPARSVAMLEAAGVDEAQWLDTVLKHHESSDGSGYPAGLREVPELALALRHVDVLLAKISARKQRVAQPIQRAARDLFQETGGAPLVQVLIKEIGIYPPGDVVRLQSGEVAVVVRRRASASTPLVASISNAKGQPVVSSVVRDTAQREYAIVAVESDRSMMVRLLPERLYGLAE